MREGINTNIINDSLIFSETFESESNTRINNKGVPTDVTFNADGTASFNGSSSKIVYKIINKVRSVELRLENVTSFYCKLSSSRTIQIVSGTLSTTGFTSATYYVNSVVGTSVSATGKVHIVITDSVDFTVNDLQIGYNGTSYGNFKADLHCFYNRALTATEVANLYNGKTNKEVPMYQSGITPLLLYDSTKGYSQDRSGLRTLTETATSYQWVGNQYACKFNGSSSQIDLGSTHIVTNQTILFSAWLYNKGNSYPNGTLYGNGDFIIWLGDTVSYFTRNNSATPNMQFGNTKNKWIFIGLLSEGVSTYRFTCFLATTKTGLTQTTSGTHVLPTNSVIANEYIGRVSGSVVGTRYFNGLIPYINIRQMTSYDATVALQLLTQEWSSTRRNYN